MSELKKMTEKELLGTTLAELGFRVVASDTIESIDIDMTIGIDELGIELVPEMPPVTIKNLGKYMAKFGQYPGVDFYTPAGEYEYSGLLVGFAYGSPKADNDDTYFSCIMRDPRWPEIAEVDL